MGTPAEREAPAPKGMDIVVVQELVAPPYPGKYPDNKPYKPTEASKEFFDFMIRAGFKYILSEENTGRNSNRKNGTASEWFVAFYKPEVVCATGQEPVEPSCDASDLPSGFLSNKRARNANYDRVPYAFGFRAVGGKADFVIISVHLRPNTGSENRARRKQELKAIGKWISENSDKEIRTGVILCTLLGIVAATGQWQAPETISSKTWLFLVLSGLATGASWLCYFRALKIGDAARVAPIDKLSVVLVAVFGVVFLSERLSGLNWLGVGLIATGALLVALKP